MNTKKNARIMLQLVVAAMIVVFASSCAVNPSSDDESKKKKDAPTNPETPVIPETPPKTPSGNVFMTSFGFKAADNAILAADITGTIERDSVIRVNVPGGTAVTGAI